MEIESSITSSNIFIPIKFNTTVQLNSKELNKNFEDVINTKLKNNLENICSKYGFIKKGSIKIIKRSIGYFKEQHFNGDIAFNLQCIAEICNPSQDSIIKCRVKAKNSLGLLAEGIHDNASILEVIIPKISSGIKSEIDIDSIQIGDDINIQVCGKKFMLYDKHISIIGRAIKDKDEKIIIENILNDNEDVEQEQEEEILDIDINESEDDYEDDEDDDMSLKKIIIKKDDIIDEEEDEDEEDEEDDDEIFDEEFDEEFEEEFDDTEDFEGHDVD
jgi:hypothetical protein